MELNQSIFLFINSFAKQNDTLDKIIIYIGEYAPFFFILVEVYLYFFAQKKNEALFAFYSMLFALFISKLIGFFYFHNRPFMDNIGTTIQDHAADSSFPSDHTTFMMAIAWSLFFSKRTRRLGLFLIMLSVISGISRVFIGVHYPLDILGALLVGASSATIIHANKDKFKRLNKTIIKYIS